MVAHSYPGRFFALMPVVMWKISEPGHSGLEHRDVDKLPSASFLSLIKSQKNSRSGIHRRCQIDDGKADLCGLIRITCCRDDSGLALDQQVISFHVAIRAILAITGQGTINQPWIAGAKLCRS